MADLTYPAVTDEDFPGPGVMRCGECGRDLPVGSPYSERPNGMLANTPVVMICCVYCGSGS